LGRFANETGSSTCAPCPPGRFSETTGASSCIICTAGSYSLEAAEICIECPKGQYQPSALQSSCFSCPDGWETVGADPITQSGASDCRICPPGKFSGDSGEGCIQCIETEIQPSEGETECLSCPLNSAPNLAQTECLCDPKYYWDEESDSGTPCVRCPDGADCTMAGNIRFSVHTKANFFPDVSGENLKFFGCLNGACLGGVTALNGTDPREDSYLARSSTRIGYSDMWRAHLCVDGYYGNLCTECVRNATFRFVLFCLFVCLFVFFFFCRIVWLFSNSLLIFLFFSKIGLDERAIMTVLNAQLLASMFFDCLVRLLARASLSRGWSL
jgi:hypothetical protein